MLANRVQTGVMIEPARDVFDAGSRGLQHHGLRRANERAVMTVVGFNDGVSNAEISRLSGLAPQTVSAILADLDRAGLIMRGEALRGRRGQPATPIFLRPDGAFAIGAEIGWRHTDILLIDLHARVLARHHLAYDAPDARSLPAMIAERVDELLEGLSPEQRERLADLGIAMPTIIAHGLSGGADGRHDQASPGLDLAAELERRTGLEVTVFNDGNAACWAELVASPRPRPANFIYFMISRCIAAGIVGQGNLWEGPTGNSANLGAMLVSDGSGKVQPAHMIASTAALAQRLGAAGFAVELDEIDSWDWSGFGSALDQWIADSASALAKVVFNTTTVIESNLVVVDGLVPPAIRYRLVTALQQELAGLPVGAVKRPQVLAGHLGALAPAMGAAELPLYRRYFSRSFADLVD